MSKDPPPTPFAGSGGVRKTIFLRMAPSTFYYDEVLIKDILSLTLILGCKNKNQPSGPIELDLEAGNLVQFKIVKA